VQGGSDSDSAQDAHQSDKQLRDRGAPDQRKILS